MANLDNVHVIPTVRVGELVGMLVTARHPEVISTLLRGRQHTGPARRPIT